MPTTSGGATIQATRVLPNMQDEAAIKVEVVLFFIRNSHQRQLPVTMCGYVWSFQSTAWVSLEIHPRETSTPHSCWRCCIAIILIDQQLSFSKGNW